MENEDRPNPDELLEAIKTEEIEEKLGRLKIFFGMSAGVGKTYSMLEEAQQKLKEGVNVVAGIINTHGRKETEALLKDLPIIPEKWIQFKDVAFEEFDLETVLALKPELVLIDELAHTNVPGSKHAKRWQDVIEILDAGIDVYTTLNVQHIESRKDIVESLTGIQIRETVPDLILERASAIELIDIPPQQLLQRLHEGKVYAEDQSKLAIENFFREENLMALREIALRLTAEKVDHDLHGILHGKGWKTRERLMAAINPNPSSEQLIRAARRLAFELDAPWMVVYVDSGVALNEEEQVRLNRFFNLARELGAEVVILHELDEAAALQRIAKQRDITRIVIGRPPKQKFSLQKLLKGSFIDRLENDNKQIDIVILREEQMTNIYRRSIVAYQFTSPWKAYGLAFAFEIGISIIGLLISPWIGYQAVGFFFLLGILMLSFFVGRGPIVFAAVISAFLWDFLFIPPLFNPIISDPKDIALVAAYFFVAIVMGILSSRMGEQDQVLQKREEKMERLYEIVRDIASAANLQYLRLNVCSRLENIFSGTFDILVKNPDNQLIFDSPQSFLNAEKEKATAMWVFQNGKIGGWSTDTLPSAEGLYFPIKYTKFTFGVLVYHPKSKRPLSLEEMSFIQTVIQQLGIYLERHLFEERVHRQDYASQTERIHQSILHSVSRSFYEPLEGITKISKQMLQGNADLNTRLLGAQLQEQSGVIKFTTDNMIAMSELESGLVHFNRSSHAIKEVIDRSLKEVEPFIGNHPVEILLPPGPVVLPFDFNLLALALNNLLVYVFENSAASEPVSIKVTVMENEFCLSVSSFGLSPQRSQEALSHLFEKFPHIQDETKGIGVGLAVVQSIADIHQGRISVIDSEERGTEFALVLPIY